MAPTEGSLSSCEMISATSGDVSCLNNSNLKLMIVFYRVRDNILSLIGSTIQVTGWSPGLTFRSQAGAWPDFRQP